MSTRLPPWSNKLATIGYCRKSKQKCDRSESILWLEDSNLEAQSYKPRKGDEFHALFCKILNVLERSSETQTHSEKSVNVSDVKGVFGFALLFSWRVFLGGFFVSSCRKMLGFSLLPIGRVLGFLLLPFGNVLGFSFLRFEEILSFFLFLPFGEVLVFFVSSLWRGSFFCFYLVGGFWFFLFLPCGRVLGFFV